MLLVHIKVKVLIQRNLKSGLRKEGGTYVRQTPDRIEIMIAIHVTQGTVGW